MRCPILVHLQKTLTHLRDFLSELPSPEALVLCEELGTFLSTIGLYNKDSGSNDKQNLLRLADGKVWPDKSRSHPDDRLKGDATGVEIGGWWQPALMAKWFQNPENLASGLTNRWNFMVPDTRNYSFNDLASARLKAQVARKQAAQAITREPPQQLSPRSSKRARVEALPDSDPRGEDLLSDADPVIEKSPLALLAEVWIITFLAQGWRLFLACLALSSLREPCLCLFCTCFVLVACVSSCLLVTCASFCDSVNFSVCSIS